MSTRVEIDPAYALPTSEDCGWPNEDTGLRVISSAVNAIFEVTQASFTHTWVVGIPLRLCGVVMAARSGSCLGFLGHGLAFAALFHPYSRWASIGVDAASECLKICSACCSDPKTEATASTAYSVLGVSRDVSLNDLNRARKTKIERLLQKQKSKKGTEWQDLQEQITTVMTAYKKLLPFVLATDPNRQRIIDNAFQMLGIRSEISVDDLERIYTSKRKSLEAERDRFYYVPQTWNERQAQIDALENAYYLLPALATG